MHQPEDQLVATRLSPSALAAFTHRVLAVVNATDSSCDALLDASVAGMLLLTKVDNDKNKMTMLSPSPLPLPSNILIAGDLRWSE
eukprot:1763034-Pleurochrysis_carterae.AAC.1